MSNNSTPSPFSIVSKIWAFCNTLRDNGVGYSDYLEQLTYLGFLKIKGAVVFRQLKSHTTFVQAIKSRLSVADKMKESTTKSLQQAEALRQSILKKAFEGVGPERKKYEININ